MSAAELKWDSIRSSLLWIVVPLIVGALIAAGPAGMSFSKFMGFVAVTLAAVNIFGGFIVTQRMLQMFQRKK